MRKVRTKRGDYFFGFNPAISDEAAKRIRAQIRSWRLHLRSIGMQVIDKTLLSLDHLLT